MSVDNVDVDMQCHEPEDTQTSHDADLFDDNDDNDESGASNFMDALSQPPNQLPTDAPPPTPLTQPPTDALRRAREEVMGEKHRFHEVDFSESLRKTLYEQKEQIKQILEEREVICQEAGHLYTVAKLIFQGELEATMLYSFIKTSKLCCWLNQPDCPPAIQECKILFDKMSAPKSTTSLGEELAEDPLDNSV
ncbi:hypothetical protein EDD22DRAFT_847212 [Suillus occidentalis]|nr:hypothetical protein EDD22DRAFT_847212 [Suillus occidentalis]